MPTETREDVGYPGLGVIVSYKPVDTGTGIQIWVLCKSRLLLTVVPSLQPMFFSNILPYRRMFPLAPHSQKRHKSEGPAQSRATMHSSQAPVCPLLPPCLLARAVGAPHLGSRHHTWRSHKCPWVTEAMSCPQARAKIYKKASEVLRGEQTHFMSTWKIS